MIMNLLKQMRARPGVNAPVRVALRLAAKMSNELIRRWPVSGEVEVAFEGVRFRMTSKGDDAWPTHAFYGQHLEVGEVRAFNIFAPHARTILDVGANTGVYSLLATRLNPAADVHAFEPHPANATRLRENLALNGATRVHVHETAIGDANCEISFTVPATGQVSDVASAVSSFSRAHYGIPYRDVRVQQRTIDALVQELGIRSIDFVKIDVEYYETAVLEGAMKTLDRDSPVLLAEVFNYDVFVGRKPELAGKLAEGNAGRVEERLRSLGYYLYAVGEHGLLRVEDLRSIPDGGSNYIFSRVCSKQHFLPYRDAKLVSALLGAWP